MNPLCRIDGRRSAAKLLTKDEARRIAVNIAKLPNLIRRPQALALYSRMLEDATFIKRQQWATTNYAVLIYAAIIWLTKNITLTECIRWLLTAFNAGAAVAAVGLLIWFQIDLWNLRERIADANNYSFGAAEKFAFGIKARDPNPLVRGGHILIILIFVCIAGAVMATIATWQ